MRRWEAVLICMALLFSLFSLHTAEAKDEETPKTIFPVHVIHKTGDDKENFVIVIMGDGYTADEQDKFLQDAKQKAQGMLRWSPYKEYSDHINIYAVQAVSNESGISVYGGKNADTYFHVKVYGKAAGFSNGGDEKFVSSNHWHFFQVPCFMGKSLLAWAFALHKHAAVWAPIIQAPHTGALITHAL